jgi:serine/threonine protein kinase
MVPCDLNPDNVFLVQKQGRPPVVKVLDFGIAKLLEGTKATAPMQGGMVLYMAPEQAQRHAQIGPRTDLLAPSSGGSARDGRAAPNGNLERGRGAPPCLPQSLFLHSKCGDAMARESRRTPARRFFRRTNAGSLSDGHRFEA